MLSVRAVVAHPGDVRMTPASILGRMTLVAAPVLGARHAVADVAPARHDPATAAACASGLPGTGARCRSDHLVDVVGPHVVPALVGGVLALAITVVALLLLRAGVSAVARRWSAPPERAAAPAWLVAAPPPGPATSADRGAPGGPSF
jgi:hypothetical protein